MTKYSTYALLLIATVTILACKTSTSPQSAGTLKGQTYLVDTLGNRLPPFDNISVTVVGTTLETTTDSLGKWEIDNVPNGSQTLRYSKSGFGSEEQFGVAIPGPGVTLAPTNYLGIARRDQLAVDSLIITNYQQYGYVITVYGHPLTYSEYPRTPVLLLSPDSSLSQSSPRIFVYAAWREVPFEPSNGFAVLATSSDLQDMGLPSGTKLYATFCCAGDVDFESLNEPYGRNTDGEPSYYWDGNLGHYVSTACGPHGNVISVIAP